MSMWGFVCMHSLLIFEAYAQLWCIFFMAQQPVLGQDFTITLSETHHTQYDSSGRVISPTQRPLPDNTQHSQEIDTHAPSGIRTRNPSKHEAADPRVRRRGHRDRQFWCVAPCNLKPLNQSRFLISFHEQYQYVSHIDLKNGSNTSAGCEVWD
jgi:hypothetical protein